MRPKTSFVRKRGENWTSQEKEMLRQLISQSAHIIENKSLTTAANLIRAQEWRQVTNKLNELSGKGRTCDEIKLAWKKMKLAVKANLSQQFHTGSGEISPSPSQEDLYVTHDLVVELYDYVSDAVQKVESVSQLDAAAVAEPSTSSNRNGLILNSGKERAPTERCKPEFYSTSELETQEKTQRNKNKSKENIHQIINETMVRTISESNFHLKTKDKEMMEEAHKYKITIAKLKIKKLELEIALLENQKESTIKK